MHTIEQKRGVDVTPGDFETAAELEALVETTRDVITVVDRAGTVKYQSPSARDVMGYDQTELVGENAFEYIHPEDRPEAMELFTEMVEAPGETTQRVEFRYDHGEDGWVWLESIGTNRMPGPLDGYVITSRDITDRKRRQRELSQYEAAMETVPDGVFLLDEDGKFRRSNEAWGDIVGIDPDEMRNQPFQMLVEKGLVDQSAVECYLDVIEDLLAPDTADTHSCFTTAVDHPDDDDGERVYEVHIGLLPTGADGQFRGTAGVVRDITERMRHQEQLERENERLNEFTDVVSHDLRNPLEVLHLSLELIEEGPHRDRCRRAVDRMDQLIEDLLVLAETGEVVTDREPVDVEAVTSRAWDTVVTEEVTLDVAADGEIAADPGKVRQLLENLFRNCVEHASSQASQDVTLTVDLDGDKLVVADDGTGFDDTDTDRLFESGYSSEDGTGLGLSIVDRIASAHGWTVTVEDSDDGGARFTVTGIEQV